MRAGVHVVSTFVLLWFAQCHTALPVTSEEPASTSKDPDAVLKDAVGPSSEESPSSSLLSSSSSPQAAVQGEMRLVPIKYVDQTGSKRDLSWNNIERDHFRLTENKLGSESDSKFHGKSLLAVTKSWDQPSSITVDEEGDHDSVLEEVQSDTKHHHHPARDRFQHRAGKASRRHKHPSTETSVDPDQSQGNDEDLSDGTKESTLIVDTDSAEEHADLEPTTDAGSSADSLSNNAVSRVPEEEHASSRSYMSGTSEWSEDETETAAPEGTTSDDHDYSATYYESHDSTGMPLDSSSVGGGGAGVGGENADDLALIKQVPVGQTVHATISDNHVSHKTYENAEKTKERSEEAHKDAISSQRKKLEELKRVFGLIKTALRQSSKDFNRNQALSADRRSYADKQKAFEKLKMAAFLIKAQYGLEKAKYLAYRKNLVMAEDLIKNRAMFSSHAPRRPDLADHSDDDQVEAFFSEPSSSSTSNQLDFVSDHQSSDNTGLNDIFRELRSKIGRP